MRSEPGECGVKEKTIGEELFSLQRKTNPSIVEWNGQPEETREHYEELARELFDLWTERFKKTPHE